MRLPVYSEIVKVAGNMAYPMGLRGERLAGEILTLAQLYGLPFEAVAGLSLPCRTLESRYHPLCPSKKGAADYVYTHS